MKKFFNDFINEKKEVYKFKKGDYVKYDINYTNNNYSDKIFMIVNRQKLRKNQINNSTYCIYTIDAIDGSKSVSSVYGWELRELTDFELATLKYNL